MTGELSGVVTGGLTAFGCLSAASQKQGYVALLDVLGFRNLLGSAASGPQLVRYIGTIEGSLSDPRIEGIVFSDSIVITKDGADDESLRVLCEICSRLMFNLLRADIPVRGAIAHGSYLRQTVGNSVFLAGNPIVEAFEYEKRQNWVGVTLAPSALRASQGAKLEATCNMTFDRDEAFPNPESYLKWKAYVQRCDKIPFRSDAESVGFVHDGFAIVPSGATNLDGISGNLRLVLERLQWLKLLAACTGP